MTLEGARCRWVVRGFPCASMSLTSVLADHGGTRGSPRGGGRRACPACNRRRAGLALRTVSSCRGQSRIFGAANDHDRDGAVAAAIRGKCPFPGALAAGSCGASARGSIDDADEAGWPRIATPSDRKWVGGAGRSPHRATDIICPESTTRILVPPLVSYRARLKALRLGTMLPSNTHRTASLCLRVLQHALSEVLRPRLSSLTRNLQFRTGVCSTDEGRLIAHRVPRLDPVKIAADEGVISESRQRVRHTA